MEEIRPFIKWAGGKNSLIPQLSTYYPIDLKNDEIETYIEPFVGGGAVLINILQNYNVKKAYAFDINKDLINCYNVIKNNVEILIKELDKKEKKYYSLEMENKKEYFYEIRKEYNSYKLKENNDVKRASEFIFLNKTCFNGLYRVNKNDEFNVPFNNAKKPTICDSDNLRRLSNLIKNVEFICGNYYESEKFIKGKTFVYFDPPYRPLNITSGFTSYTKFDFNDEDQKNLANYYSKISSNNVKLMLSNSNPKNTNKNDTFFEDLYEQFTINEIYAKRMINSKASGRGEISELLITNYKEQN